MEWLRKRAVVGGVAASVVFLSCSSDLSDASESSDAGSQDAGTTDDRSQDADTRDTGADAETDAGTDAGTADGGGDAGCGSGVTPEPGLVVTDKGAVRGVQSGDSWAFLGIPYAAPPVGELRYRPPVEPGCLAGTLQAVAFREKCLQLDENGDPAAMEGSEDCLVLNVWTPAGYAPGAGLPVLAFIHGGGHMTGSASEQAKDGQYIYDGSRLAVKANAVVVTMNYRLNAFGFVAHRALSAESGYGGSGNYGTMDQIAAFRWVRQNAAAFGGDPAKVLLFGESAGAVQTCMNVVSPLSTGLFRAALMESGACTAKTLAEAEAFGAQFAEAAGCDSAPDVPACLRALTAEQVVKAYPQKVSVAGKSGGYQPNVDGHVIPEKPADMFRKGTHNRVPLVVGANSDETSRWVPQITEEQYEQMVLALVAGYQPLADAILAEYPSSDYGGSPRLAYIVASTDAKFICTARTAARAADEGQDEPVYRYLYSHALENGGAALKALGAYHGSELPLVFGNLTFQGYVPTAGEAALSDAVIGYWSRLAATGDPNGGGAPEWPVLGGTLDAYLRLDDPMETGQGIRTAKCDFWDTLIPQ
ncbi:MAG: carboxylesterase family protein [Deltaproteobacteria bacterium]|nr:carboxylesterase family protein [Deltaproteobacteria bacterium]